MMSAIFGGLQTPFPPSSAIVSNCNFGTHKPMLSNLSLTQPPFVSNGQHLLDPPSPPRQPSSAFDRPPSTNVLKEKTLFDMKL